VIVAGLAFDFCVGSTALDAKRLGFKASIIKEATRSVSYESHMVM
jgi:nicotinamidase-related amidase